MSTIWNIKKVEEVKSQKLTSYDWHDYVKKTFLVIDPKGWKGLNVAYPDSFYKEEITKEEFERRVAKSTISLTGGMISLKNQLLSR